MKAFKQDAHDMDLMTGPLWNKILAFALPLAATGVLQQLFNAADLAVVGRFTGAQSGVAMAAVGANAPIIGLVINTFIGISLGTNVVIANAVGREDEDAIQKAAHTSVLLAVVMGLFIAVCAQLFAVRILSAQNIPEDVLDLAVQYFRIYMAGAPVILLYNFESAVFRGIGNTKIPLLALSLSGVLNVALNLFFVCALHMMVEGVALATALSNLVNSTILTVSLARHEGAAALRLSRLRADGASLKGILRNGVPAGIQAAVFSSANIIIQSAINSLGTVIMAASSAAYNIEVMAHQVLVSFSRACTTIVSQNDGAGNYGRCKRSLVLCYLEGMAATALAMGTILFFGHQLLALFNPDPEVIRNGYYRLVVIFISYFFTHTYETIAGYLRGFGISVLPALLTMAGICGVRIAWIYTVFPSHRTFESIMMAYPLSLSTTALLVLAAMLWCRPAKGRIRQQEEAGRNG